MPLFNNKKRLIYACLLLLLLCSRINTISQSNIAAKGEIRNLAEVSEDNNNENQNNNEIPCCKENNIISCKSVHVLPAYLGKSIVHLPNEIKVFFLNKIPASTLSYHYANHGIDAIFNYNPATKKLHGQVHKANGQVFNLENCGKEVHVWKEINTTFTQDKYKDNKNDYIILPTLNNDYIRDTPVDNITMTFISVKFYYTPSALSFINDIDGFVDLLISSANQGFINSRVPITIRKHCVELSTIDDIHDSNEMLTKFKEMKSSIDELKGSADATTLIVNDMDACGNSYFNGIDSGLTLSVIIKSCALLEYSLAHELGHNMGIQHNLSPNKKYLYGHGHLIKSGNGNPGSRTIMAYFSKGHEIRKNVFSNPSVLNGETGTRIGIEGKSNSAAVLLRNRMRMSLLGDESEECFRGKIHESTRFATPNITIPQKFSFSNFPKLKDDLAKKNSSIPTSLPKPEFRDVLDKKNNTSTSPLPLPKIKDVLDNKKNTLIPTLFVGKKSFSITTSMPFPKLKDDLEQQKNTSVPPPMPKPVPKSKDIFDKKANTSAITKLKNEFSAKKNSFKTTSLPLTKSKGILNKRVNDFIHETKTTTLPPPKLKDDNGNKNNTSISTLPLPSLKDGLEKKKNTSKPIMTLPLPKVKNELVGKTNNSIRTTLSLPGSKKDIGNKKNTLLLALPRSNVKDGLGNQKNTSNPTASVPLTKINLGVNKNTSIMATTLSTPTLKPLNSSSAGLPKFDPSVFKLNKHSK